MSPLIWIQPANHARAFFCPRFLGVAFRNAIALTRKRIKMAFLPRIGRTDSTAAAQPNQ
jgi:hypothetical protein